MIGSAWTPKEFLSDAVAVAPKLLGQYLVHQTPDGKRDIVVKWLRLVLSFS